MGVRKGKTRTNIVLDDVLKKKLQELAEEDNRSFNNYVCLILANYVKDKERN